MDTVFVEQIGKLVEINLRQSKIVGFLSNSNNNKI